MPSSAESLTAAQGLARAFPVQGPTPGSGAPHRAAASTASSPAPADIPLGGGELKLEDGVFGKDGFTFSDFLDIINPLQHIPIVNAVYRELTGDTIKPAAQLAGDTLFGGPIGAVVSVANLALSNITGRDAGEHLVALAEGAFGDTKDATTAVATAASSVSGPSVSGQALSGPTLLAAMQTAAGPEAQAASAAPVTLQAADMSRVVRALEAQARAGRNSSGTQVIDGNTIRFASMPEKPDAPAAPESVTQANRAVTEAQAAIVPAAGEDRPGALETERARHGKTPIAALKPGTSEYDAEVAKLMSQRLARRQNEGTFEHSTNHMPYPRAASAAPASPNTPLFNAPTANAPLFGGTSDSGPSAAASAVNGAVAADGGWFSEAMLKALEKYEQAKGLKADEATAPGAASSTGNAPRP